VDYVSNFQKGKGIILDPLLSLMDEEKKCYSCGEKATHVGLDGTYTRTKQICIIPLLRRLRQEMD